ncbi:MAG: PQQ-like beta-propeller repeat protein [Geothrix sp.]|uniref:hypothetical protein n=1 Tax=Geothrix sp. TaxID=1962974 RepID=UPI001812EABC|nr:hypothetical protein [Geothrix sp.]NWJ41651.1 PQQ-like beta-propeller repeat protein [Geothrix sp.]WIL20366.1 MAG: hypothetical protein QOZ81_002931 [Geothrix sp.]
MRTLASALLLVSMTRTLGGQTIGGFETLGTYRGIGGQYASAVGPGPTEGSERLYATYLYLDKTFDLLAIDLVTTKAQVFPNPVKGEFAARCMTLGPDGKIYVGSAPNAHLLQLDPRTGRYKDLGQTSPTESFIWDLTFGVDGKLYGGTSPNAKLVRFDPITQVVEDLGRLDPKEDYAHYLAASGDGFIYAGIGAAKMNVAAYRIKDGERRGVLPPEFQVQGQANVYKGVDGRIYAVAGKQSFLLQGWEAKPIEANVAARPLYQDRLRDGRTVALRGRTLTYRDSQTGKTEARPFQYDGNELPIFRIGLGPDGEIYGSSALPAHLFRWDARLARFLDLADLGGGEVYSFLASGRNLLMASYGTDAPLYSLDPSKPPSDDPKSPNPVRIDFAGADKGWRPLALVEAKDGNAYIGAIPGYGRLGGPLCFWDLRSGKVEQHMDFIKDQSVVALCPWKNFILGGTNVSGGMGSHPTQQEAKLFCYDPAAKKVVFEVVLPGFASFENLQMAPNGLLYGIGGRTWFAFDPDRRALLFRKELPFPGGTVYSSVQLGADGRIWGLAGHPAAGIFAIDPATQTMQVVARPPKPITAGMVIKGGFLYFASGSELYRYEMPKAPH